MTLTIISGKFKGFKLASPKNIRPTTAFIRDAIFNICQNQIENALFLDVFADAKQLSLNRHTNLQGILTTTKKKGYHS